HVGEEHGHMLARTFEGTTGGENLLDEMSRGVGPCVARGRPRAGEPRERRAAVIAYHGAGRLEDAPAAAGAAVPERGPACLTGVGTLADGVLAVMTSHPMDPVVRIALSLT